MKPATLAQLQEVLLNIISKASNERPTTGAIFQLMYNTGLRVREVLEVERWQPNDDDTYSVQLEKREGVRVLRIGVVPDLIEQQYASSIPFVFETYSSVNNTFKYHAPGLLFGSDTRRTTCHAFRYQFMKQLAADGLTIKQIGEVMGHVNAANTAKYVQDEIWLGS